MPIDLNRDQFGRLPKKERDMVIFDNVQDIKTSLQNISTTQKSHQTQINNNRAIGGTWLFILTVAMGMRNYIPFLFYVPFLG